MQTPSDLRTNANKTCLTIIMERLKMQWKPGETVEVEVTLLALINRGIDTAYVIDHLKRYDWVAECRNLDEGWLFTITA